MAGTTQSAFVPFDEEQIKPIETTLPPELSAYVTEQQWQAFCDSAESVLASIRWEHRIILSLGILLGATGVVLLALRISFILLGIIFILVGILIVSPLTKTLYVRPRLLHRMTKVCKETTESVFSGVIVQFKSDKGHILTAESVVTQTEEVHNYYIDIWLVRPSLVE